MKTIKTTHIDTGGHGYYSVSKKDILLLGIKDQISHYSGHNVTRVFLEEDQDGTLLYDACKALDYVLVVKSGYNLSFAIDHNYKPSLFSWTPEIGKKVVGNRDETFAITEIHSNKIIVWDEYRRRRYKISLSNPFKYITAAVNS